MAAPQLLSRKPNVIASTTANQAASDNAPKQSRGKAPVEGEKVAVRRLPPGMTVEEFLTILGDEWKVGNGKVAWLDFRHGKVSSDPAKPSRPAVAYLLVLKHEELVNLDEAVRTSAWRDAKESWDDPSLIGPPVLELAMYKKVPSAKRRNDTRQGTIDQDPEYMAFLASLTNPEAAAKDGEAEAEENGKPEKATSTPLIDYLREKKANKAKETQAAKNNARHSRQESSGKTKPASQTPEDGKKKNDGRLEQPREKVRILTKKATEAAAEAAKNVAAQIQSAAGGTQSRAQGQEPPVKSRRADVTAMARILQRDLGLSPGNAHRQARRDAAAKAAAEAKVVAEKAEKAEKPVQSSGSPGATARASTPARPNTPTAPKAMQQPAPASTPTQPASTGRTRNRRRGGGGDDRGKGDKASEATSAAPEKPPVVLLRKKDESTNHTQSMPSAAPSPTTASPAPSTPKATTPTTTLKQPASRDQRRAQQQAQQQASSPSAPPASTRAFIKHANPSQGVTEALLKQALATFGPVASVEIDRRKGVAYATFEQPDGLAKAISASPLPVPETEAKIVIAMRKDKEEKGKKTPTGKASAAEKAPAAASASTPAAATTTTTDPAPPAQRGKGGGDKASMPSTALATAPADVGDTEKADGQQKRSTRRGRRGRGGGGGDREKKEDLSSGAAKNAGSSGRASKEIAAGGGGGKKTGGGDSQSAS